MALHRHMPIIYIEDDADDRSIFADILKESSTVNPLLCFETGEEFLRYLLETDDKPLVIFCDINMPGMAGMDIRKQMIENVLLCKKNVPFVFLSTGAVPNQVEAVNELNVQGYFLKTSNFHKLSSTIRMIVRYWSESIHSNRHIKADEYL